MPRPQKRSKPSRRAARGPSLRRLALHAGRLCVALVTAALALGGTAEAQSPYPRKSDARPHHGVRAAKHKAIQGIDVSRWQQDIDWDEVKAAGTRFAFIKATEGGDHLDEKFARNWREARRVGIPRGAYHFVWWCRPGRDQARWFIRNVPREAGALPPVLDVEWNTHSRCPRASPEIARARMREILAAMEAHYGRKPIIYTDINFHADVIEGTSEFERYPFWVRSTAARPETRYTKRRWEFWQFTTTGRVPGVTGDVDRNAFFGSERQFRDWMTGSYDIATRTPIGRTRLATTEGEPVAAGPARSTGPLSLTPPPRPPQPVGATGSVTRRP